MEEEARQVLSKAVKGETQRKEPLNLAESIRIGASAARAGSRAAQLRVIILDTNAVSETLKPVPAESVLRWVASQEPLNVFITVITQAEMLYGVEILASGKRKQDLSELTEKLIGEKGFQGRILPFDQQSAREFARILAIRRAAGRPMSQFDAMIAAIARAHRAALATRNTADFEHCGIRLIDPETA
jgi:predicted nucleic acid-binding protein